MVTVTRNLALGDDATGTQTGTVGEPAAAASGQRIYVTGNWYATRSTDGGTTWSFVNPFNALPPAAGGFCCDQLVLYSTRHRLWVWLLQYINLGTANVIRLATSRTGAPGSWAWRDIGPTDVNPAWTNVWFDYPDMAESVDHLWVSLNVYDTDDAWRRAVVLRLPMAELASPGPLTWRSWSTTQFGSLRFAIGSKDTMWFASNSGPGTSLRLFAWADAGTQVSSWPVPVSPWNEGTYSSRGPGNAEWLSRADGRITGAWRSRGVLGFAWTANLRAGRPHPYIRAVRIDETTLQVVDEPDLWSPNGAWAYPAAAPNRRGDVGLTAFFGGPTHPAHAVGWLDETTGRWEMTTTATSTHGPLQGKWGDYLTVRAHPSRTSSWVASGFTLEGGTDRRNITPRLVVFRP